MCTAVIGNFGNVTLARVDKKETQQNGINRNAHQHLPQALALCPSSNAWHAFYWKAPGSQIHSFFSVVVIFILATSILGPQWTAHFKDCQSTSNRWTFLYYKNKDWSTCIPWWQSDLFFGNKPQNQSNLSVRKIGVLFLTIYVLFTQTVVNDREKKNILKYFKLILSLLSG